MSGEVLGEVVRTGKGFPASVAPVRPLTRVDPQVTVHVALTAEGPPAEFALERPLPRVLPDVQLEILLRPESLATKGAKVGTARVVLGRGVGRASSGGRHGRSRWVASRDRRLWSLLPARGRGHGCSCVKVPNEVLEEGGSGSGCCGNAGGWTRSGKRMGQSGTTAGRLGSIAAILGAFPVRRGIFRLGSSTTARAYGRIGGVPFQAGRRRRHGGRRAVTPTGQEVGRHLPLQLECALEEGRWTD